MLSSTRGALNRIAAAKRLTEMVLPKRRGVEIRISCDRFVQPLACSSRWWSRWKVPAGSVL
jgi:hypothetical protein